MCRDVNGKYKFSFMEMITSGRDGSTSATGFAGMVLTLTSMLMALCTMLFYFFKTGEADHALDFLDKSIMIMGIGAGLLGTRKISGVIGSKKGSADIQKEIDAAIDAREEREDRIRRRIYESYNSSSTDSSYDTSYESDAISDKEELDA